MYLPADNVLELNGRIDHSDRALIKAVSGGLQWIATGLIHKGVKADMVSWTGFLIGMASVPLIITQNYHWALGMYRIKSLG